MKNLSILSFIFIIAFTGIVSAETIDYKATIGEFKKAEALTNSRTLSSLFQESIAQALTSGNKKNTVFRDRATENARQAIAILDKLIEYYPDISKFYSSRSMAYAVLSSLVPAKRNSLRKQCREDADKSIELDPGNIEGYISLFFVDDDRSYLETALQIKPDDETANVYYVFSKYVFPSFQSDSSTLIQYTISELERIHSKFPANTLILFSEGILLLKLNNKEQAHDVFEKSLRIDQDQPAVKILYAALHEDLSAKSKERYLKDTQ
ncbi:MAG: tetratricopeptide repeat protein [Candidatus Aureabacteria bacterium]|nr:tetratricopeptide repeat protein [Candidatus Auribacterota bacterium]